MMGRAPEAVKLDGALLPDRRRTRLLDSPRGFPSGFPQSGSPPPINMPAP